MDLKQQDVLFDKQRQQLIDTAKIISDKKEVFIKQIIVVGSALLSVIVSLYKNENNQYQMLAFLCTVVALGVGILTGAVALYSDINTAHRTFQRYKNSLLENIRAGHVKRIEHIVNAYKIFFLCEITCYLSFFFSIIFLVWYAIQLNH